MSKASKQTSVVERAQGTLARQLPFTEILLSALSFLFVCVFSGTLLVKLGDQVCQGLGLGFTVYKASALSLYYLYYFSSR